MANVESVNLFDPQWTDQRYSSADVMPPTRPEISLVNIDQVEAKRICPTHAIGANPTRIDLGKCIFCHACAIRFPEKFHFTEDDRLSSNVRDRLIILEGESRPITFDKATHRKTSQDFNNDARFLIFPGLEMHPYAPLVASFENEGIHLTPIASEACGIIVIGAVTDDLAQTFRQAYQRLKTPRLILLSGAASMRSGIFSDESNTTMATDKFPVDAYIPGNNLDPKAIQRALSEITNIQKS